MTAFAISIPRQRVRGRVPRLPQPRSSKRGRRTCPTCTTSPEETVYDTITIGSGLGALSASALLTTQGLTNITLEAHTTPGGAAHSFTRCTDAGKFTFESGPHLFSGLAPPSNNPLQHVLLAANINLEVIPYLTWGIHLPDRYIPTPVSKDQPLFSTLMQAAGGPTAAQEVASLLSAMEPLGRAATLLPPLSLRVADLPGTLRVASRYFRPSILPLLVHIPTLSRPFSEILHRHISDPFALHFLNLLCFLLAGVPASRIPAAEVAFMFREWATPPRHTADLAALQHPKGGASAIARELVRAIERDGRSKVRTRARVRRVIVEGGRAIGVELTTGEVLHARRAVICGVSSLDVPSLIKGGPETKIEDMCPSFMHLHVAVQMTEDVRKQLPGGRLEGNYVSVEDWEVGVETAGNVVLISVPSVLDSDVAPEGWAVLHAYTPATEPWEMWEGLKRGSKEYEEMKEVRVKPLWRALKRVFGQDVRQIAQIQMVASPLTHAHFLNRCRGSYGPRVDARKEGLGLPFPGSGAFPTGFFRVGDGVFPGVGVPAVAGSAWMVANGIVSVEQHLALLDRIGL